MTTTPIVSVIMPVYNGALYVAESIKSVLDQTEKRLELIIVDDCSTDDSSEIIRPFLSDTRIKYLRNTHSLNVAGSRNRAISVSTGQHIALLDQDDVWLPKKLETQIPVFTKQPNVALVYGRVALIDSHSRLLEHNGSTAPDDLFDPSPRTRVGNELASIFLRNEVMVPTVIFRKSCLDDDEPFSSELPGVDDYLLWMKLAIKYDFVFMDTVLALYRIHPNQQSKNGLSMLLNKVKALETITAFGGREVAARIGSRQHRQRLAGGLRSLGDIYAIEQGKWAEAARYYWRALRYHPADHKTIFKLAYCYAPEVLRHVMRLGKRFLKAGGVH